MKLNFPKNFKFFISILCVTVLTGCFNFGSTPNTDNDARLKTYESPTYTVKIPKEWDVIEKNTFTAEIPPETDVVFRNNVKNETFTPSVAIQKNNLLEPVNSLEYSKLVMNRQKNGLYEYKELKRDEYKVKIGDKEESSSYVVFEAKKSLDEKSVRYLQTFAVKDKTGYIVLGAVSPLENENNIKTLEEILKSFRVK